MNVTDDTFPGAYFLLFLIYAVLALIVHIAFASAVHKDAQVRAVKFVTPGIWGLATLIGGVLTAALYWLIHHSSLANAASPTDEG